MRASEGRIRESNREMDVAVTRNISRENRRAEGAGRIIAILLSGLNNAREDYGVRRGNGKSGTKSSTWLSMTNPQRGKDIVVI